MTKLGEHLKQVATQFYTHKEPAVPDEAQVVAQAENIVKRMAANGYIFDDDTLAAVEEYARGYSLLLFGNVGVGKTMFFRLLSKGIQIWNMNNLSRMKYDELMKELDIADDENMEIVIDDIGAGSSRGKDYGVEYDVLLTILNRRERAKKRTHFTTNIPFEKLCKIYDYRCIDRLIGMVKPITIKRKDSLRKAQIKK